MHALAAVGALLVVTLLSAPAMVSAASVPEPLWPQGAPGALGATDVDVPALTTHLPPPARSVRAAVVVCPGGYAALAMQHEGADIAAWLNQRGIAAFVLRYRHGPKYLHPTPLGDVQRAIRTVRSRAQALGIDPARIGVWGFSAGGHLASTAATLPSDGDPKAVDPIDRVGARPDFAILGYPVIMMVGDRIHKGSRRNLLGEGAPDTVAEALSTDRRVTAATPPTFLFHTADDAAVPVENALAFFAALRRVNVPAELHVYESGRHGVGLAPTDPILRTWPDRLEDWLRRRQILSARTPDRRPEERNERPCILPAVQFGPWHAIADAAGAAPDAAGVLQVRSDGLHQYPRGRSAMMLYLSCAPGETLRTLVVGRARPPVDRAFAAGARWIRFAAAADAEAEGARLLDRFIERFGAAPTINQDPLVNNG